MINILLDLDQTCISAESLDGKNPEFDFQNKEQSEKSKLFNYKNMDDYYIIFERPGLQKFLDFLFKNFNVSIWTAASKDYALFIIDKIILGNHQDRKLDWIFFSYHCKISEYKTDNSKDLTILNNLYKLPNYTMNNTVILDDNDEVYFSEPNNCLIAPPFEFKDYESNNDNFLKQLQQELEKIKNSTELTAKISEINRNIKEKGFKTHI